MDGNYDSSISLFCTERHSVVEEDVRKSLYDFISFGPWPGMPGHYITDLSGLGTPRTLERGTGSGLLRDVFTNHKGLREFAVLFGTDTLR